ncbi:MAG: hypothetical protein QN229_03830 [Desulfurococcaceae archaeon TW002]
MYLKMPPKIKILEAAGAVADGRIEKLNNKLFRVISSERDRTYSVYVDLEKGEACSTDNGTTYRGYIGYPIISSLLILGVLPYDAVIGRSLANIDWRRLNETLKNYSLVEEKVKEIARDRGVSPELIDKYSSNVYEQLRKIKLVKVNKCLNP